jgi:hypothetical protein
MSRENLFIIHFRPLELYPPIQNLLTILNDKQHSKKITTITTFQKKIINFGSRLSETNQIIRKDVHSKIRIIRLIKYINFYFFVFFKMLQMKPIKIIYFETISAFPAILYKKLFPKTELFVHYHEYTSIEEYKSGMRLERWNWFYEKKNYKIYKWISHTNKKRLELFSEDNPNIQQIQTHVFPNFPLEKWASINTIKKTENKGLLKFVYVGPLDIENTYINEFCQFISVNPSVELKIISQRIPDEFLSFLHSKMFKNIEIVGTIEYNLVPEYLIGMNIGVILYKCNTLNQKHAAPNKLFEYLACGLDVWFPKEMEGCFEYISDEIPKVIKVDFDNIKESLGSYIYENRSISSHKFSAEHASKHLIENLEL